VRRQGRLGRFSLHQADRIVPRREAPGHVHDARGMTQNIYDEEEFFAA
jgi:hypothetical protein